MDFVGFWLNKYMKLNSIGMRIIIGLLIFIFIIHGWWQITFLLGIFGIWRFNYFVEIIFAGIVYDSLFGINGYSGVIIACVIFLITNGLKRILRR